MTPILDTARISDVNSVMSLNRIKKMVGFELGKDLEKDVFHLFASVGQRMRNQTSDLRILHLDTLPLNYRNSVVIAANYEVHV